MPRRRLVATAAICLAVAALAACTSTPAATESATGAGDVAAATPTVVALGDSFTAGFGYYDDGTEWDDLFACTGVEETEVYNNPCASNSALRSKVGALQFAPDYGFANQVSWAAQTASALGVKADSFANLAITGSTPRQWAEDQLVFDQLDGQNGLAAVASLKPDIVLMTLGGNPTLSKVLLGEADQCKAFDKPVQTAPLMECFDKVIAADGTTPALTTVYQRLLDTTDARILVLTYPYMIPQLGLTIGGWSPEALLIAGDQLNAAVMRAVTDVRKNHSEGTRLLTADPQFATGLPPGDFTSETECFGRAKKADGTDGPSNQSIPTQELYAEDYAESGWCAGPAWAIASDTGAHPNVAGYAEFTRVALAALRP